MADEKRPGLKVSGWCLCRDHERCRFAPCTCSCHAKECAK